MTPQHRPSVCSRSHNSLKSIDVPYSVSKRFLFFVSDGEEKRVVIMCWCRNNDDDENDMMNFASTYFSIGCNPCIILSNLNIQNIPRSASPANRTSSSSQYAFNNLSERRKAPKQPIICRKPAMFERPDTKINTEQIEELNR